MTRCCDISMIRWRRSDALSYHCYRVIAPWISRYRLLWADLTSYIIRLRVYWNMITLLTATYISKSLKCILSSNQISIIWPFYFCFVLIYTQIENLCWDLFWWPNIENTMPIVAMYKCADSEVRCWFRIVCMKYHRCFNVSNPHIIHALILKLQSTFKHVTFFIRFNSEVSLHTQTWQWFFL